MDCQYGSVKAFEMLIARWHKRLCCCAYNITGDPEAARGVRHLAWYHKKSEKFERSCQPQRLAYRIATNKSIDWIRKNEAVRKINIKELEDHQHKEEKYRGVKELLQKLDVKKKVVLSLYYFEQLSVPEISEAQRIPKGTVGSRLHRARKNLKELWQQHLEQT